MPGTIEKIKEIEAEMARTQRNKATEHHFGVLKAKLAKYRAELIAGPTGTQKAGDGFDVERSGDVRVAMIGFPSVGKSTLLSTVTKTESQAAAYEFTTLTCIPGKIEYKDTEIQLLDLPGIIEGASKGKGRGRQVIAVARSADVVLMMLDASKAEIQRELLIKELEDCNIRVNQSKPDVTIKKKKAGGVSITNTVELSHLDEKQIKQILQYYKIHNADILIREDITNDQLIDLINENVVYMPCIFCINKIDTITLDEVDRLARQPHTVVVSCEWKLNLDAMLESLWTHMDCIRIYTKPRGKRPSFTEPLVLKRRSTVRDVCNKIHKTFAERFKYALVWGASAKHQPQQVGLNHVLEDEDVVQLMASK